MSPKFIVRQKITAFVNKYMIYESNSDGSTGKLVALAQQKRVALKEKINFYSDESKQQLLFSMRAEKVMDVHGKYLIEDANGQLIGALRKEFKKSLLRSTWVILGSDEQPAYQITESNESVAIMRRFVGFIPIVGDIAELVIKFIKYHFTYIDLGDGTECGRYEKITTVRDHYTLHTSDKLSADVDWRVLAGMSVALDALQSR